MKTNFIVEKLCRLHLNLVNFFGNGTNQNCVPTATRRTQHSSCDIPAEDVQSESKHEEISDKPKHSAKHENVLQNSWPLNFKCQDRDGQRKIGDCSRKRRVKGPDNGMYPVILSQILLL